MPDGYCVKERNETVMGYCVKERKKVPIADPQQITMKNGRPAVQGHCPDCKTKIFKIGRLGPLPFEIRFAPGPPSLPF